MCVRGGVYTRCMLLPWSGYSLCCLGLLPQLSPWPCEIMSMTLPCSGHPFPLPHISPTATLFHRGNEESRLGPLQPWVSMGHTHPWMQWAAVTTQSRSMRAPPHTCSFSTRRLTSQGQWRVTSKFFGHQGLPQASGTSVTGRYSGRIEEDKNDCDQDALQGNLHEAVNLGTCFHFKEGETEGERRAVACPKAFSWTENDNDSDKKHQDRNTET